MDMRPLMKEIDVIKIEVLGSGEMIVQPDTSDTANFVFIYRAAAGVRWDEHRQVFVTPTPKKLSYGQWFQITRDAVASELGVDLKVTDRTQLINLPPTWSETRRKQ
jgi:hypothetical protein